MLLLTLHTRPVLVLWENTSYRMAEEQRRRNASRRKHVDVDQRPGLPPRMVNNAGGVDLDESSASIAGACHRHGLVPQPWVQPHASQNHRRPRVFDVMLLEGPEIELLETRLHELSASVDRFILVEGRRTVHGKKKPTFFSEYRGTPRFVQFRQKLVHYEIPEPAYRKNGRDVLTSEIDNIHRTEMRAALRLAGVQPGDVVLAGNANEIPFASTLGLFVGCEGWPSNATTVGLLLEPFVFSFELGVNSENTDSSSGLISRVSKYTEALQSAAFSRRPIGRAESGGAGPVLVRDAGWKCTCCFAALSDYGRDCQDLLTISRFGSASNRRDTQLVQRVLCGGSAEGAVTGAPSPSQHIRGGTGGPGMDRMSSVMRTAAPQLHRRHGTGGVPKWLAEQTATTTKGVNGSTPVGVFLVPGHCDERVVVRAQPPPPPPPPVPPAPQPPPVLVPAAAVAETAEPPATAAPPALVDKVATAPSDTPGAVPTVLNTGLSKSVATTVTAGPDKPDAVPSTTVTPIPTTREESQGDSSLEASAAENARKQLVKKGHGRDR